MTDIDCQGNGEGKQSTSVSLDTGFDLLRSQHRRLTLAYLRETDCSPVSTDRVATAVTTLLEPIDSEIDAQEMALRLRHIHLPRLEEASVIDYNSDTDEIRYIANSRIEKLLDVATEEDPAGDPSQIS